MRILPKLIFSLPLMALLACGNEGVNTLDELTFSSSTNGAFKKPVNLVYPMQSRFLSVNGQLPVPGPGSSCMASSKRVANSIICFSSGPTTQNLVKEYGYTPSSRGAAADLQEIRTELVDLQTSIAKMLAGAQGEDGQTPVLDAAAADRITAQGQKIQEMAARNNLFIFRWASDSSASGSGASSTLLSANGSANSTNKGIVIVAGLKVSQLLVSPTDFDQRFGALPEGAKLATLTMSAQHLLYFAYEDLGAAVKAKLDASPSALGKISAKDKIALDLFGAIGNAQENQGQFSAPTIRLEPVSLENSGNWQVFYATMTDIDTLAKTIHR